MPADPDILGEPITVPCDAEWIDQLLEREWLITNGIGAYASSSVVGCNTRRYHGLLVAAATPPVGRIVALATVNEQIVVDDVCYDISTNEFQDVFSPLGVAYLKEFRNDLAATFVYRIGDIELIKRVILADNANACALQYSVSGLAGRSANLILRPLVALRDFHALRHAGEPHQMTFEAATSTVVVQDRNDPEHCLYMLSQESNFQVDPQWWYGFRYRADLARGQDGQEDLYSPGVFAFELNDDKPVQFNASLDEPISPGFDTTLRAKRERLSKLVSAVGDNLDDVAHRLAAASDAFIVKRSFPSQPASATILAGYPWFADWGRDAFIALPGLLLSTGQFDTAKEVFSTFAQSISEGMVPNRFDDYALSAHYNSIDASLWFIIAAERFMRTCGDATFWRDVLAPAAETILAAYESGTLFGIRADSDKLLIGGSQTTQLTWMDTKLGDEAITPRHGKAVEINALWYNAHCILAHQQAGTGDLAEHHREMADLIAKSFVKTFWNIEGDCLYDCVSDEHADPAIRPNQIFAVSLPHSPLAIHQQKAVLSVVTEKLLTPYGLRTLAPDDPAYRGRYEGDLNNRDRAYHQGTVWPWLLGAFIEAHLKLKGRDAGGVARASEMLSAFDGHLHEAGLGAVSEIFDGDPPHLPRGCISQAWSVAEIIRAKKLIADYDR